MLIELKKQMDLIYIFQKKSDTRIHLLRVANKPTFSKIKSLGAEPYILGLGMFDWVLIDWANVLSQTYV